MAICLSPVYMSTTLESFYTISVNQNIHTDDLCKIAQNLAVLVMFIYTVYAI